MRRKGQVTATGTVGEDFHLYALHLSEIAEVDTDEIYRRALAALDMIMRMKPTEVILIQDRRTRWTRPTDQVRFNWRCAPTNEEAK